MSSPFDSNEPRSIRRTWFQTLRYYGLWLLGPALVVYWIWRAPHEVSYWYAATAMNTAAKNDLPRAVELAKQAVTWSPKWAGAHRTLGRLQLVSGDSDNGLVSLIKACELAPDDPRNYQDRLLLVNREHAGEDFAPPAALANKAQRDAFRIANAEVLSLLGKHNLAWFLLSDPGDPLEVTNASTAHRVRILQRARRYADALKAVDDYTDEAKKSVPVLMDRAGLLLHLGKFKEAIDDVHAIEEKATLRVVSRSPSVSNQLAYFRAVADVELDQAELLADAALSALPDEAAFLDTRGFVYYRQKRYAEALEDLDRAIAGMNKLDKQEEQSANDATNVEGAEDMSRRIAERNGLRESLAVLHYHRMLVLEALGEKERAEQDRQAVIKLGEEPGPELF